MPTGSQKGEPSTALMAVSGDPGVQPAPQRSSTELQGLIDQANALQLAAHTRASGFASRPGARCEGCRACCPWHQKW